MFNGQWQTDNRPPTVDTVHEESRFKHWITTDGSAGKTGDAGFTAESKRYHLFVSLACPWAQRTLIFRELKGLKEHISVSLVEPELTECGWQLSAEPHPVQNIRYLHELYRLANPQYHGRVTVPVLWDKQRNTIVSNESADIIRMFNSAFNDITDNDYEFYFSDIQEPINQINDWVYQHLNRGVYAAGFASNQAEYEKAYHDVFYALDELEEHLSEQRFLVGNKLSEADWRLLPTLLRFDAVYHPLFKLNKNRLSDYPNISDYLRELFQQPGIGSTFNLEHIKRHYYLSFPQLNPSRIIPLGPELDFVGEHNRRRFHE